MIRFALLATLAVATSLAQAQVLTVTLLGTGTPRPDLEHFSQSILVETPDARLLFDAGRGAVLRLHEIGVSAADLTHVFLTHLHYDHMVGLDDVWLTAHLWQRRLPFEVSGPTGTASMVKHLRAAYQDDLLFRQHQSGLPKADGDLRAIEVESGLVWQQSELKVTAFAVDHGAVKPALGYRVDYGAYSVVISGDTTYTEGLIQHAEGADVVIHEAMMASPPLLAKHSRLARVQDYHSTPQQVGRSLSSIQPRLAVLIHLLKFGSSDADILEQVTKNYAGDVRLGQDLMAIDIGESLHVYSRRP